MKDKKGGHVNAHVEMVILPGESGIAVNAADQKKIRQLIQQDLLLTSTEPYHKVQVEVVRRPDGLPKALVASMLRAHTYTADVVTVSVDADYQVKSIQREGGQFDPGDV